MNKKDAIDLVRRFQKCEVGVDMIGALLERTPILIFKLLYLDDEYFKKGVMIINTYSDDIMAIRAIDAFNGTMYKDEAYDILTNKDAISYGIDMEAMDIIKRAPKKFNAEYASMLFKHKFLIEGNICLEGMNIIMESKEEFNALYAYNILTNMDIYKSGISLDGARVANDSVNDFNARYVFDTLSHVSNIREEVVLNGSLLINRCDSETKAFYVYSAIINWDLNKKGISLIVANIIVNGNITNNKFSYGDTGFFFDNVTDLFDIIEKKFIANDHFLLDILVDEIRDNVEEDVDVKDIYKRLIKVRDDK